MQLCCISALLFSQVSRKWVNWFLTVVISAWDECNSAKASLRSHCCCTNLDLMHTQTQNELFKDSDLELKNTTLLYCKETVLSQENANYERKNKMRRDEKEREKITTWNVCLIFFFLKRKRDEKKTEIRREDTTLNVQVERWERRETWKMREEQRWNIWDIFEQKRLDEIQE